MPLYWTFKVRGWRRIGCRTAAPVLCVLGWNKAHFAHTGDKRSKFASVYTVNVQHKATLIDTIHNLLSYAWAFEVDYGVQFIGLRIMDIEGSMLSSNFFAINSAATYIRFDRASKDDDQALKRNPSFCQAEQRPFNGEDASHHAVWWRKFLHFSRKEHSSHDSSLLHFRRRRPQRYPFWRRFLSLTCQGSRWWVSDLPLGAREKEASDLGADSG